MKILLYLEEKASEPAAEPKDSRQARGAEHSKDIFHYITKMCCALSFTFRVSSRVSCYPVELVSQSVSQPVGMNFLSLIFMKRRKEDRERDSQSS